MLLRSTAAKLAFKTPIKTIFEGLGVRLSSQDAGNTNPEAPPQTNAPESSSTLSKKRSQMHLVNALENDLDERRTINPKETTIVLFPGQGAQYVGMAAQLMRFPSARSIFELANEVLGYDLLKLCIEGPLVKLNRTEYAQLAVMVSSLAALEQLREERPRAIDNCVATAGFSLGEITALVYAGALPFDKALRLVQVRANAMQAACDAVPSGMALVLYGPDTSIGTVCAKAQQWCLERGVESPYCGVANYMYPHCKVIAGNLDALKYIEVNAKALKIKRMKRLPVSGAFHTPIMQSAVEPFTNALKKIYVKDPLIRVYSNVDGKQYRNATHILRQLPKQIANPVKWEQTMHLMYERREGTDFPRTFECGPGKGLKQVLEKVNAKAANSAFNIEA
ncbi:probable malonyl-CoA-acyl carrier protein transacylase, mitochondrial [Anastrepha obliqua]|uniref:probable malonyl-CoA-acyl carrier protein transacylase, mitochondrial n=1 Tax=Anastrepha obliqua TaxID=95512 RepID=UPI0024092B48|nr:probable malonyl-CoA-acyl carrier protein transacylase, mitochondrial [Anastrepha obliqua]